MNSELDEILRPMGMSVETRLQSEVAHGKVFQKLAVVQFKGVCNVNRELPGIERGSLGVVQLVNGDILPFIDVYCGRIHDMIREDLRIETSSARIQKFGRALARVVAHELYHVFSQTARHTQSGITKDVFTARDLLADQLGLDEQPLQMMLNTGPLGRERARSRKIRHAVPLD